MLSCLHMTHTEIREKFLNFFKERGHTIVPSSSLLPTDPSVLFTTAGMQQFKPYYTGQADAMKDFGSLNTASIQKSMRTSDIDEVGDESHLTFFEMLGNFSFGGYFKKEAIQYAHEFITKEMGLEIDYVSVFAGEGNPSTGSGQVVPEDTESQEIWKRIDSNITIKKFGRSDNFWGPTGNEGPCGPTSEIYVKGLEVWNLVFNEFYQHPDGRLEPLKTPGIDTGMGLERLAMVVQQKENIFETDLFTGLIDNTFLNSQELRNKRIIADHARASVFLIADGVIPSNKEQGYILRRLMRRALVHLSSAGQNDLSPFEAVIKNYQGIYPNLNVDLIIPTIKSEADKFGRTINQGIKELSKLSKLDASAAFRLYESYGLPFELLKDIAGSKAEVLTREDFDVEFKKHQEKSRAGAEKKFGGHGMVAGDLTAANEEELKIKTRLHTATHLLHTALRQVLGNDVKQAGSDITAERLRFDFSFPRKLTTEEIEKIEAIANTAVEKDYPVKFEEMNLDDAIKAGALAFFKLKYPERVKVYTIGNDSEVYSKEICGGPHVTHTNEISHITIKKDEAVSAGVRRIRAIVS